MGCNIWPIIILYMSLFFTFFFDEIERARGLGITQTILSGRTNRREKRCLVPAKSTQWDLTPPHPSFNWSNFHDPSLKWFSGKILSSQIWSIYYINKDRWNFRSRMVPHLMESGIQRPPGLNFKNTVHFETLIDSKVFWTIIHKFNLSFIVLACCQF